MRGNGDVEEPCGPEAPGWIEDFAKRLAGLTDFFVADLKKFADIRKSDHNAAGVFFEYSYGPLNIFAYVVDSQLDQIGETTRLPSTVRHEDLFPDSLGPNDLSDDEAEEFDHQKSVLVETWISDCWDLAVEGSNAEVHAFLSIHDTYVKTNLNTKTSINTNQIAILLGAGGA